MNDTRPNGLNGHFGCRTVGPTARQLVADGGWWIRNDRQGRHPAESLSCSAGSYQPWARTVGVLPRAGKPDCLAAVTHWRSHGPLDGMGAVGRHSMDRPGQASTSYALSLTPSRQRRLHLPWSHATVRPPLELHQSISTDLTFNTLSVITIIYLFICSSTHITYVQSDKC